MADHPSLRLVFLNACEGAAASQSDDLASSAAAVVRRSVPAVVAMQYSISDASAIEFARTFYESLADNLSVDAAVTDARKAVSFAAPHSLEWATPVLFLAATDGRLFSLEKAVGRRAPVGPTFVAGRPTARCQQSDCGGRVIGVDAGLADIPCEKDAGYCTNSNPIPTVCQSIYGRKRGIYSHLPFLAALDARTGPGRDGWTAGAALVSGIWADPLAIQSHTSLY